MEILVPLAVLIVIIAIPIAAEFLFAGAAVDEIAETIAEASELGAEIGAADDVIATTSEGMVARNAAVAWRTEAQTSDAAKKAEKAAQAYEKIKNFASVCTDDVCRDADSMNAIVKFYSH